MLLHFVPRMFASRVNEPECTLIDFRCAALGLNLRGGVDLATRRPYPNKNYAVACRKVGQKAMNGFLVETPNSVCEFTTITRWAVGAEKVVNHQVQYIVLDDELDAMTDDMTMWNATAEGLGGFSQRWPAEAIGWNPATAQPRMELLSRNRAGHYSDRVGAGGEILERAEVFHVHTVERERIETRSTYMASDRIPAVGTAFRAAI